MRKIAGPVAAVAEHDHFVGFDLDAGRDAGAVGLDGEIAAAARHRRGPPRRSRRARARRRTRRRRAQAPSSGSDRRWRRVLPAALRRFGARRGDAGAFDLHEMHVIGPCDIAPAPSPCARRRRRCRTWAARPMCSAASGALMAVPIASAASADGSAQRRRRRGRARHNAGSARLRCRRTGRRGCAGSGDRPARPGAG